MSKDNIKNCELNAESSLRFADVINKISEVEEMAIDITGKAAEFYKRYTGRSLLTPAPNDIVVNKNFASYFETCLESLGVISDCLESINVVINDM